MQVCCPQMASLKLSQSTLCCQFSPLQFNGAESASVSASKQSSLLQCGPAHLQKMLRRKLVASEFFAGGAYLGSQTRFWERHLSPNGSNGAARSATTLLEMVPEVKKEKLILDLPRYDPARRKPVDLVVVGAGPAGLAVAQRVSKEGLGVCVIDPSPQSVWPNNYGVWVDEFEAMDLLDCLDHTWGSAVVYLDDENKKSLERPYGRVNRRRLKSKMMEQCIANGVQFYPSKVRKVSHLDDRSFVSCEDDVSVEAAVVLDATGHSRRLVEYDKPFNPGYQIAYGIVAEVDSHPFDIDKMLFMDWRDSHLHNRPDLRKSNQELPTFLYAMPFSANKIFLEETSLVARPGVPMEVIQRRMEARLKHLGINVMSIEEDEKCIIPMGGVLPRIPQRVLGIGGTAGMVHPSTGYMVARTLAAAPILADAIVLRLGGSRTVSSLSEQPSSQSESTVRAAPSYCGDELSAGLWADLWPIERKRQREFFCFGMDVLLKLDLDGTRRFFDAFFNLEPYHWQGFLSSRLFLGQLLTFGLSLFAHATNTARFDIMLKGTVPLVKMISNQATMKR
eukprot:TRINITY_DN26419_c0_g1_i1.p1 TRINITY_DN26419_c0_g1~~TRINITY_DN26419_c0_g1_i1.p1  ORF type:complete len:562 (-),score=73.54 TRINITY_DN26419_c0_g1_i1:278-1963(-)